MEISYLVVSAHPPHRHAAPVRRRHFATLHRLLLEQVRQAADGLVWSEERHRYLLGLAYPAPEPLNDIDHRIIVAEYAPQPRQAYSCAT
jgi:hypothetical protein